MSKFFKSWKTELELIGFMTIIMGIYFLPWFKPEWFR